MLPLNLVSLSWTPARAVLEKMPKLNSGASPPSFFQAKRLIEAEYDRKRREQFARNPSPPFQDQETLHNEEYALKVRALLDHYIADDGGEKHGWGYDRIFEYHLELMEKRLEAIQKVGTDSATEAQFRKKYAAVSQFREKYMAIAKPKQAPRTRP